MASLADQQVPEILCLCPPSSFPSNAAAAHELGLLTLLRHIGLFFLFYVDAGDPKSDPQASIVSTLFTEPNPHSHLLLFHFQSFLSSYLHFFLAVPVFLRGHTLLQLRPYPAVQGASLIFLLTLQLHIYILPVPACL